MGRFKKGLMSFGIPFSLRLNFLSDADNVGIDDVQWVTQYSLPYVLTHNFVFYVKMYCSSGRIAVFLFIDEMRPKNAQFFEG